MKKEIKKSMFEHILKDRIKKDKFKNENNNKFHFYLGKITAYYEILNILGYSNQQITYKFYDYLKNNKKRRNK